MAFIAFPIGSVPPSAWTIERINADRQWVTDTGFIYSQQNSGARWRVRLIYNNPEGDVLGDLRGYFARTADKRNTWQLAFGSALGIYPRGVLATAPVLNGAHSAGATLINVDNGKLSTSLIWQRGDFISINNELKICGTRYDSDANGEGAVEIWPPLHRDYSNGQVIDDTDPPGRFYWMDDSGMGGVPHRANVERLPQFTITFEEEIV